MNRKMRQSRERVCNSSTSAAAAAAGGDPRSTQRPPKSHVGDQNESRPRCRRDKETTTSETTRRTAAAAAAAAPPPPPPPLPPPPPPLPRPRSPSISSWRAIFAEDYGQFYFYNSNTGETTWEPPRKSRMVRGATGQRSVVNRNIGAERGAVTVRSRSLVTLLKGGKIECRAGSAVSLRSDGGKRPLDFPPRKKQLGTIDATGTRDQKGESRTNNRTSARSTGHPQVASVRGTRPISGKLTGTRKDVAEQQGRAWQKKPLEKGGSDTKRALKGKREGVMHPEETTPVPSRHGKAEACYPRTQRSKTPLKSEGPESSSGATRVATSLLRAENWLAKNEPEVELERPRSRTLTPDRTRPRPKSSRGATRLSCKPVGSSDERVMACLAEGSGATTTARLRGRAAAVWASVQAQRREEEEMTGKPEITRLGRSKRRSVDDLFLFQRNVEDSRRRKRDQREAHEKELVTGRPETCGRSTTLVKQMRRDGGADRTQLSTSKRLYGDAREQRQRQETLQMQVDTAIRRRANPTLSVRSRSLPRYRSRGDAACRLYEQAIASRDDALQRERYAAQNLPRGVTFHPNIHQRSTFLAQRRRERWASAVGLGVPRIETGSVATADPAGAAVQEFLLAEGALYDRRRRERQLRQEELALRSKIPAVNRHSRRLLQKAERVGRSLGVQDDSHVPEDVADVDSAAGYDFSPRLEALDTSKRMLESRYGRGSIPSMEQRSKERERERLEKEAQLDERNKENRDFVARRVARSCPENGDAEHFRGAGIYERTKEYLRQKESRWASEREALLAEELADCTFSPEFRTKRRGHSRYRQQASGVNGPNSSLAGEVSDYVVGDEEVVPAVGTVEVDGSASRSVDSSGYDGGGGRRSGPLRDGEGSSGLPTRRRRRPKQQTTIEDKDSGVGLFPFFGEEDVVQDAGGSGRSGNYSVGSAGGRGSRKDSDRARGRADEETRSLSALLSRRPSGGAGGDGYSSTQDDYSVYDLTEDGSDHFFLRTGDAIATAPSASARNDGSRRSSTSGRAVTAVTGEGTPIDDHSAASPLPSGWTAFTSPEGWAYFFNEETSAVQWKRPTR